MCILHTLVKWKLPQTVLYIVSCKRTTKILQIGISRSRDDRKTKLVFFYPSLPLKNHPKVTSRKTSTTTQTPVIQPTTQASETRRNSKRQSRGEDAVLRLWCRGRCRQGLGAKGKDSTCRVPADSTAGKTLLTGPSRAAGGCGKIKPGVSKQIQN